MYKRIRGSRYSILRRLARRLKHQVATPGCCAPFSPSILKPLAQIEIPRVQSPVAPDRWEHTRTRTRGEHEGADPSRQGAQRGAVTLRLNLGGSPGSCLVLGGEPGFLGERFSRKAIGRARSYGFVRKRVAAVSFSRTARR